MMVYQYFHTEDIPKFYRKCMDELRDSLPENVGYKLVTKYECPGNYKSEKRKSVSVRFRLLSEDPEGVWFDSDIKVIKWFDFEFKKDKPYIMPESCGARAIYTNGNTELMKTVLDEFEMNPNLCGCKVLRRRIKEFNTFPSGYIVHSHSRLRGSI